MSIKGELLPCACGSAWWISVPSAQWFCKHKAALKVTQQIKALLYKLGDLHLIPEIYVKVEGDN